MCLLSLQNRSLQARHTLTCCNHSWCHINKTMGTHSSSTNMVSPLHSNLKQVDLSLQKNITRNIVTEATTWHVMRANTTFINGLKVAELIALTECIYNCVLLHYKKKKQLPKCEVRIKSKSFGTRTLFRLVFTDVPYNRCPYPSVTWTSPSRRY